MKTLLLPALASGFVLAGCWAGLTRYKQPERLVVVRPPVITYAHESGDAAGDSSGVLPLRRGDTLVAVARRRHAVGKPYYLIAAPGGNAFFFVQEGAVEPEVIVQSPRFTVHESADRDVWTRAASWLTLHADTKVRTQTDNVIETHPAPANTPALAYTVTRTRRGDSTDYEVRCTPAPQGTGKLPYYTDTAPDINARRLSLYILTGRLYDLANL